MTAGDRLWKSRRQEKRGMERFGGVLNPRSGARWDRRNDGRTATELVEYKRTDNQRYITLRYDDLDALYRHAMVESRRPVLVFELGGREWVALPEPSYHELVDRGREPGAAVHLRAGEDDLVEPGQVPRPVFQRPRQPVLRRATAQQQSGSRGKVSVPGNPPGPPRALPGPGGLSQLRHRERGEVRSLGRVLRKRTPPDQAPTTA